jgi:dihydroorotase
MTRIFLDRFHIIDPASGRDEISSMVVENGVIAAIGTPQKIGVAPKGAKVIKGDGAILTPGLIDMRVQSRYPGYAHKETRASLARAAAAGGITSMICLPNTNPVLDNPDSLTALIRQAPQDGAPAPRIYAYGAATKNLDDTAMAELGLLAEAGAVGFTNGVVPISDSLVMRRIMNYAAMLGKPVIQHAEDLCLAAGGEMHEGETSTRLGLKGIPAEAEEIMIARDLSLVRLTGVRYHVAHISTSRGVEMIRAAKAEGLPVTCDTAPPYYMLNDIAVMEYDTRFRLSPPLREEGDRQAVLAGIADGTIDVIASDHAPQDRDSKLLPFGIAETGSSALETLLPLVLNLYHDGHISLMRAIEMISTAPASLLDIPGGVLTQGAEADFIILDPGRGWQIRGEDFNSLSTSTPFEGQPVQGKILSTWIGGEIVYENDQA